jgi:glycosyltransferase involved in cell wall biosynthesis
LSLSVSIVVPCYNAAEYVEETLQSLLAQTYPNLEIIAINDGSKDSSIEILNKYADKIKVVDQENCGQSKTLNKGWSLAKGDLLGYLSADDLMDKTAVEEMVKLFEISGPPDIVYPDYRLIDQRSRFIKTVETRNFVLQDLVLKMICQPGPGALFRRQVFLELNGWREDLRQAPDFEFWLRASRRFKFARYDRSIASFRIHEASQSFVAPNASKSEEPFQLMKHFTQSGFHPALQGAENIALAQAHVFSARLHIKAWRFGAMIQHLSRAFLLKPTQALSFYSIQLILHGLLDPIRHRLSQSIKNTLQFYKQLMRSIYP